MCVYRNFCVFHHFFRDMPANWIMTQGWFYRPLRLLLHLHSQFKHLGGVYWPLSLLHFIRSLCCCFLLKHHHRRRQQSIPPLSWLGIDIDCCFHRRHNCWRAFITLFSVPAALVLPAFIAFLSFYGDHRRKKENKRVNHRVTPYHHYHHKDTLEIWHCDCVQKTVLFGELCFIWPDLLQRNRHGHHFCYCAVLFSLATQTSAIYINFCKNSNDCV